MLTAKSALDDFARVAETVRRGEADRSDELAKKAEHQRRVQEEWLVAAAALPCVAELHTLAGAHAHAAGAGAEARATLTAASAPREMHALFVATFGTNALRTQIPNFPLLYAFKLSGKALRRTVESVPPGSETLAAAIRRGMGGDEFLEAYAQVAAALAYAHEKISLTHYALSADAVVLAPLAAYAPGGAAAYIQYGANRFVRARAVALVTDLALAFVSLPAASGRRGHFSHLLGGVALVQEGVNADRGNPLSDAFSLLLHSHVVAEAAGNAAVVEAARGAFAYFSADAPDVFASMLARFGYRLGLESALPLSYDALLASLGALAPGAVVGARGALPPDALFLPPGAGLLRAPDGALAPLQRAPGPAVRVSMAAFCDAIAALGALGNEGARVDYINGYTSGMMRKASAFDAAMVEALRVADDARAPERLRVLNSRLFEEVCARYWEAPSASPRPADDARASPAGSAGRRRRDERPNFIVEASTRLAAAARAV